MVRGADGDGISSSVTPQHITPGMPQDSAQTSHFRHSELSRSRRWSSFVSCRGGGLGSRGGDRPCWGRGVRFGCVPCSGGLVPVTWTSRRPSAAGAILAHSPRSDREPRQRLWRQADRRLWQRSTSHARGAVAGFRLLSIIAPITSNEGPGPRWDPHSKGTPGDATSRLSRR